MSYDKKFREKAIKYYEKGHTFKQTANTFEISTNTLNNWLKQKRQTGDLQRKYRSYKSKINEEDLNKYLKQYPSAYQSEIAQYFKCDISTVFRRLKRLKITRKKILNDIKNKIPKNMYNNKSLIVFVICVKLFYFITHL